MVYAVKQEYRKIYDPEVSLLNGTIFEELNKPFKRGSCRGASDNGEGCF
ncbi:MAG: spore coat associated protein CotJA [Ruminococcaceae bacterium]|nr:spore coat associated protein CotJA [Oscillospiraceae bacterium]